MSANESNLPLRYFPFILQGKHIDSVSMPPRGINAVDRIPEYTIRIIYA